MKRTVCRLVLALLSVPVLLTAGCSRPQPTAEEVAGARAPSSLGPGPMPPGGSSMSPTGGGAGGSAAGGMQYELGQRAGGSEEQPTMPPQPYGIDSSRMSPVNSSGSGDGDRGRPIPPNVSLAAPPDHRAKARLAPANRTTGRG